jgi:hypothetical protein
MKRMQTIFAILLVAALAMPTSAVLADTDTLGPLASAVAVTPNPATVNTTITVTATADDSTTGGSNILSAEFSVNAGAWTPMSAADGAFDAATENVTAAFMLTQAGANQVCVRGTDALNNIGDAVCATLTGQYQYTFTGFFNPIRMSAPNKVNASRTIPVKWSLTLLDGTTATSPASFVALKSYAVDCATLAGDISTAVVEPSAGKLHKIGKGKWMFNWKTSKTYQHTCRMMFVLFNDGQSSPSVLFSFR